MSLQEDLPITPIGAVAPTGTSEGVAPRRSLLDLIEDLARADDALADPNFNPLSLVEALRDKVDAVHTVLGRMEATAAHLKALAKPIQAKAAALTHNYDRLRDYVTQCLLTERACRQEMGETDSQVSLPGNAFRVRLRESQPALQIDRTADATDFEKFPDFVVMNRSYSWRNDAVKDALKKGSLPSGIPGRLTVGHWPEFVALIPNQLEHKKEK